MPFARNGDVELWFETFGDPADPTLLLVNGLGSQCINFRTDWCTLFSAEGLHVVRFDNRDVGRSTKFADVTPDVPRVAAAVAAGEAVDVPYLLSDMAADAVAVLDELGVERAHAVGFSMGGMIVQTLAVEHPDRVASMTSVMSTTGEPHVGRPSQEAQRLLYSAPPVDRDAFVARQIAAARTWGSPAHVDEARIAAWAGEAYDRCFDPDGQARQLMAIMASGSRGDLLPLLRVPTLVLHGDADRLVDPSGGRRTAELVPGARFELLEGMGHDYPPAFWPRIVELVAGHARAAVA
jgi:pimeloyl-ACP methyl ester carboxylesterase